MRSPLEHRHASADALAAELADDIARTLAAAIVARGAASFVVSGGRTPARLFAALAATPLAWAQVSVTLADERWVDADAPGSNEAFVRRALLREHAAAARFVPLKNAAPDPAAGRAATWQALEIIARPFDVVLLGMGDDGHTASLFPDSPGLAAALDVAAPPACVAMRAPVAPEARISLNLAALIDARRLVLHIEGEGKWHVYQRALDPAARLPVGAVLRQSGVAVEVHWAP